MSFLACGLPSNNNICVGGSSPCYLTVPLCTAKAPPSTMRAAHRLHQTQSSAFSRRRVVVPTLQPVTGEHLAWQSMDDFDDGGRRWTEYDDTAVFESWSPPVPQADVEVNGLDEGLSPAQRRVHHSPERDAQLQPHSQSHSLRHRGSFNSSCSMLLAWVIPAAIQSQYNALKLGVVDCYRRIKAVVDWFVLLGAFLLALPFIWWYTMWYLALYIPNLMLRVCCRWTLHCLRLIYAHPVLAYAALLCVIGLVASVPLAVFTWAALCLCWPMVVISVYVICRIGWWLLQGQPNMTGANPISINIDTLSDTDQSMGGVRSPAPDNLIEFQSHHTQRASCSKMGFLDWDWDYDHRPFRAQLHAQQQQQAARVRDLIRGLNGGAADDADLDMLDDINLDPPPMAAIRWPAAQSPLPH